MMFRSRLQDLEYRAGSESTDVRLFTEDEIPWDNLAFSTIRYTLELYFQDRSRGQYPLHLGDILKEDNRFIFQSGPESS